jgi:hypothetical protein
LDGALIGTSKQEDTRFGLDFTHLIFFGDNDGDDADIDVSEVAIWSEPLDENQVKKVERKESKLR